MINMMSKHEAGQLKAGNKVRILVDGCGDVGDEHLDFKAGETVTIDSLDQYDNGQGLAVTIFTDTGIVNIFDELDYDGSYPFERLETA